MDAAIVHAIATAAMGQAESTHRMLRIIRSHEGFPTTSARWGAAWALGLLDDPAAEGLLLLVLDERPHVATFAALLAYIQSRRGKTRSALENARKASALEPENGAITWLVVHLLLSLGNVHDAARSAEPLRAEARTDLPLAFLFLRLALLERDDAAGREWAQVIRGLGNNGEELLALAGEFATARIESDAAELYGAAAEAGFTPEANIGLAALATFRGDREAARRHLLAALQFDRARLSKNANASDLFHQILARLGALREERVACRAWIASFPSDGSVLAERSLLVCAANEAQARDHLYHVVSAMSGDERAFDLSRVVWRDAPADDQPIRPIQPGVKAIVS